MTLVSRQHRAFTLAELLVVVAIVAILASLLFPVFARARAAALKTVCASNMRQSQIAVSLYVEDYEDRFMPVNHRPGGPLTSANDRTWVQVILPYARSFSVFRCPEDKAAESVANRTFDQDLLPGDSFSQYYTASQHVNTGYNYLYIAPIVKTGETWTSRPKTADEFSDQSHTILFVDSIGDRDRSGAPSGGGSWLVSPPCRFAIIGQEDVDTFGLGRSVQPMIFGVHEGWDVSDPNSPARYGGAWAWHSRKANLIHIDGSIRAVPIDALAAGCNVQANWHGNINDLTSYLWFAQ